MCQMRVVMEKGAQQEKIMEEVVGLEVTADGVVLSSFFDEPRLIAGARIKKIDFMQTTVTLIP